MLACLGHLNIQWDWPRCPSPLARHLYPFVMLSFQCFVASSLGQSMPHSCSFRDPMFSMFSPFSISGYMPATKIKSLHSTAGSENIWQFCCQNLFHKGDHSQRQILFQAQNHFKKNKEQWTLWDHVIPSAFYSFHLISFNPNFKRPIPSQKWILKQQVRIPLNIPKQSTKITCQCTNPFHHLARATPKTTRKPFQGHGRRFYRPRPPSQRWPPQRSAARPRRPGRSQSRQYAAPCQPRAPRMRRGRRGCCSCRSRNKAL